MRHFSNCLFFAALLWWRLDRKGKEAYFMARRSRLANGPHFLVGEMQEDGRLRVVSFVPNDGKAKSLPPPCFDGHVKWGDKP